MKTTHQSNGRFKKLTKPWRKMDDAAVGDIIETEMAKKNFPRVIAQGQKNWKPLNPRYVKWKRENYGTTKIWRLTGKTEDSLTTKARIGNYGGRTKNKTIEMVGNKGVITITYRILPPAAGGKFGENNTRRRIFVITTQSYVAIQKNLKGYLKKR